jgi:hypothetical protein
MPTSPKAGRAAAGAAASTVQAAVTEPAEGDTGVRTDLPFATAGSPSPSAAEPVELGVQTSVGHGWSVLSVAAGVIAALLGGATIWLRSQIGKEPSLPW